jgi:WD40 repeat protein
VYFIIVMFVHLLRATFTAIFLIMQFSGVCQSSSETFGKNRIQRKKFEWKFISSQNFDVYYYGNNKDLAAYASRQAEENFDRISNSIGFSPYAKIKLMVYSSIADLHQSNIGLQDNEVLIGGYTNFIKSRVEVAFRGTRAAFNDDINKGVAKVIINEMMFGGSLKDVVQSSYLLALPDWFLEGASRYIAEGWSIEMDNYMRDLFLQKKVRRPGNMEGEEAFQTGHSIWNFISKKYGEDNIANIMNLTRIVRDEEESIENTLAMPFNIFLSEWENYYGEMADRMEKEYTHVDQKKRIRRNPFKSNDYRNLVTNPEGTKIAYSVHHRGKYKIVISDTLHKRSKIIKRGGYKLIEQQENLNTPLLSWATNRTLAYVTVSKGNSWLRLYDTQTKRKVKVPLDGVNEVLSIDFSDDGKYLVLSAVKNAQSDIFVYDLYKDRLRQITNDAYDDIQPQFVDSTLTFVFSSNRVNDTLSRIRNAVITSKNKFNIFKYDSDSSIKVLQRLSKDGNNFSPSILGDEVVYLSDRTGIYNLFLYSPEEKSTRQVSKFLNNISSYSTNYEKNALVFTMQEKGRENLYYYDAYDFEADYRSSLTPRQEYLTGKRSDKKEGAIFKSSDAPVKDADIDIHEFEFESDKKKQKKIEKERERLQAKNEIKKDAEKYTGPYKAISRFSVEKIVSTFKIDPLRGLGLQLEGGLGDLFENHKMNAGLYQSIDLRSNAVFGEYAYLRRRVDFRVRFERDNYYFSGETSSQRYTLNKFIATASYPISVFDRVSISPFAVHTRFTSLDRLLNTPEVTRFYTGLACEYVYDNTEVTGMNMIEGTKLKIGYEQYLSSQNKNNNFSRLSIDLRHYQPLHKEIVFASRASFGSFYGASPKKFTVGGMDNWLFNAASHDAPNDPLVLTDFTNNEDLLFLRFVTSLRGFNYNTIVGSKYMLFNGELRIPLVRYLYRGTITSNFFRNFQLIGFTDIGSAWSGNNPFNKDNNINKRIINDGQGTFVATVTNYKNPFLIGYGLGARTLFLGYYVKFDVGWGIIDYQQQKPRYYITLGYDF